MKTFRSLHLREFGFATNRDIVVESIGVRGTGSAVTTVEEVSAFEGLAARGQVLTISPKETKQVYINGLGKETGIFRLGDLPKGVKINGPALVIDSTQTIFVSPNFHANILTSHIPLEKIASTSLALAAGSSTTMDRILLFVFTHRLLHGHRRADGHPLQRTSISTSIKERIDFSCAIFSPEGALVANAPHIPIHLGSMQFAIQAQHRHWTGKLQPGDILLTDHPQCGSTQLPDLTAITPVFIGGVIAFYVTSRGHHTDMGGRGIISMAPESKELWEEGLNVPTMKIVSAGEFLESEFVPPWTRRTAFQLQPDPPYHRQHLRPQSSDGSEPTGHHSSPQASNTEVAVRSFFKQLAASHPEPFEPVDYLDDGTAMKVRISIDPEYGSAVCDFSGSGPQRWGNYNCPISICHSAIIYIIRCLFDVEIPLNEGCLKPVGIKVPEGSVLNPKPKVAICGSTLASQRVIDVILRAFGRHAASQGCANSFEWGTGGKDSLAGEIVKGWNYGEGSWCQRRLSWRTCHSRKISVFGFSTVSLGSNYLLSYGMRRESGGVGKWRGGDGITREIQARILLKLSILSGRRVYQPYGMAGGGPRKAGANYAFVYDDGGILLKVNLGGKAVMNLKEGEYIQINTPGGGAYGGVE
ncbi:5-oxoprolinase (ATP-hydrolysing) [Beauveria brongniartii RCEF 3172]|uniref:5-oxoprolinase (ATP-hydrolysing) n=1 Tax=Beauveria brongniartii RCEF 3172 TaxID=1081107 RepID=A0A167BMF0_9HYPO|nr:5-oxoprolinase (ATP-hydrolysing) [Beauveria brongniartii RCEF 3172]